MHPITTHPSQAVERIREIIAGRRLEQLERRLERLEASGTPAAGSRSAESRLSLAEAQIESLREQVAALQQRLAEATAAHEARHQADIQRLAAFIQHSAAQRPDLIAPQAAARLEQKLSTYLAAWQQSLQQHLLARDQYFKAYLDQQLAALSAKLERAIADNADHTAARDDWHRQLARIAAATQAWAAAIRPPSQPPHNPA
jgi:DNA repair exonuclease SbcCD ATPase subunit